MSDDDGKSSSSEGSSSDSEMDFSEKENVVDDDMGGMEDIDEKIQELKQKAAGDPGDHDSHFELLSLLRKNGDLEELSVAREQALCKFPLPAKTWIEWIEDAKATGASEEEVQGLFDRALGDFQYPEVWMEYIQWACGQGPDIAIQKFEEATQALGLRFDVGWIIWSSYLDLVETLYEGETGDAKDTQRTKLEALYKRVLSIPCSQLDSLWARYEKFAENNVDASIKSAYEAARKLSLEFAVPEEKLAQTSGSLDAYYEYLQFELEHDDPARIQSFYERLVEKHSQEEEVWIQYGMWMEQRLKINTLAQKVYERAVRNCPSCCILWQQTILAMERAGEEPEHVDKQWEKAKLSFSTADEGRALYRSYLYLLRRRAAASDQDYTKMAEIYKAGQEELRENWPRDWDPNCEYRRNYAWFAFTLINDYKLGHIIWEDILASGGGRFADKWVEAVRNERQFGKVETARKMLYRALNSVSDHPHIIYETIIQFEREEGTLEELDKALEKVNAQAMHRAQRPQKQQPERKKPAPAQKNQRPSLDDKKSPLKAQKRPAPSSDGAAPSKKPSPSPDTPRPKKTAPPQLAAAAPAPVKDSDGFVMPGLPVKKPTAATNGVNPSKTVAEPKEPQSSTAPTSSSGPEDKKLTLFVSNLDFKCPEEKIREVLSPGVVEVRLLFRGMSKLHKGYGYVDMDSQASYQAALKKDRTPIDGRPIYVSEYNVEDRKKGAGFKFSTGLDKKKLFVRHVHFDATADQVKEVFEQFGNVAEVRLVTHKSGKSKGLAYVDMETEEDAQKALDAEELVLLERKLSVALSNPPKKGEEGFRGLAPAPDRKGHSSMIALVPRAARPGGSLALKRPVPSGPVRVKLSNDQFRQLLNKGK